MKRQSSRRPTTGKGPRRSESKSKSGGRSQRDDNKGEKRSFGKKESGFSSDRKKSYGKKDDSFGSDRKRSYGKREDDGGEKRSYSRRSDEGGEKRSYGKREGGFSSDRKKSYGKKEDSFGSDRKRSYGKRDGDTGEKRSYSRRSDDGGEKRSYGKRDGDAGEKRSYSRRSDDGGEKRSYGKRDGDTGEKRSYSRRSDDGGEKRSYGKREEGFGNDRKKSFTLKKDDGTAEKRGYGRDKTDNSGDRKRSYAKSGEEFSGESNPETEGSSYFSGQTRKGGFGRKKEDGEIKKPYIEKEFSDDEEFDFKELSKEKKSFKKSASAYNDMVNRSKEKKKTTKPHDDGKIRLNKFVANTGICSRREADTLIATGVIRVNGQVVTELGTRILPTDKVHFHDQLLSQEKMVYVLLNKPKDYITTTDDPEKRKTVLDLVENATRERLYPVGRLDRNTTGLLLMTNDGELTDKLTHPRNNIKKIYHVMTDKNVKREDLMKLKEGFELEDGFIKVDDAQFVGDASNKRDIGVEIHSGKNRIVRRMFEHLGYDVIKLDRVMFAGLVKKDLPRGKWRFLSAKEVSFLKML